MTSFDEAVPGVPAGAEGSVHKSEIYGIREAATEFPMMVVLSFVYVCNARCPNCPYNNSSIRDEYRDALFMPDDLFKRIADESGPHKSLLRLSGGGEPMLHPNAVSLIEYAKEKGARIGLISNGSLYTVDNLTRLLQCGVDALEFSVDAGDEDTYEWTRPGLSWDRLNENVRLARKLRDELGAETRIIASAINQKGVDVELVEKHWGDVVDKVQIRKYLTWGYNSDNSADNASYLPPEERIPCPWLFERLNVDSKGDVTLCGEDIAFKHKFANVYEQSIKEIWLGEHFASLRAKHVGHRGHEIGICSQCPDWQYRSWNYNYWKILKDAETKIG